MELRIQIDEATYGIIAGLCQLYPGGLSIEEGASRMLIQFAVMQAIAIREAGGKVGPISKLAHEAIQDDPLFQEMYQKGVERARTVFPDAPPDEGTERPLGE